MKKIKIFQKDGNVCVSVGNKVVFSRTKTEQTVSIANDIYFYHFYKENPKRDYKHILQGE